MPFAEWMNGRLNNKFLEVINSSKAKEIYHINYLISLMKRVKTKNLKKIDWINFVLLSWISKYKVEI
jgi:hypothetical protein